MTMRRTTNPTDADDYVFATPNPGIPTLPFGYTWLNNPPGDPTQEIALGALIAPHPAAGSFWVGFANDALAGAANRPHQALGESIDLLDEKLRRAVATPKYTGGTAPGGGLASLTLAASEEVFLGDGNTGYGDLFTIVDSTGAEIIDSVGAQCAVTLTNPPSGDGALKYGFSLAAVQLTIDPPIPAGTNYEVHYGGRSCLAELPRTASAGFSLSGLVARRHTLVDARVRQLLLDLHGGTSPLWTDAWTTSIYHLAYSGLDNTYRKSTAADPTIPELGFNASLDTAGAGSFFYRDGPGMTGYSQRPNGTVYSDTFDAIWAARGHDAGGASNRAGGGLLILSESGWGQSSATEYATNVGAFTALHANKMALGDDLYDQGHTAITYGGTCQVAWSLGEASITLLEANDHFWEFDGADNQSNLLTHHDILEVYNPTWSPRWRACVVDRFDLVDPKKAYLRELNGGNLPAGAPFAGNVRWNSTVFNVSGGTSELLRWTEGFGGSATVKLGGMTFAAHPAVHTAGTYNNYPYGDCAKFAAVFPSASSPAVKWGSRTTILDGSGQTDPVYAGTLWGDGSLAAVDILASDELTVGGYATFNGTVEINGDTTVGLMYQLSATLISSTTVKVDHIAKKIHAADIEVADNMVFAGGKSVKSPTVNVDTLSKYLAGAVSVTDDVELTAEKYVLASLYDRRVDYSYTAVVNGGVTNLTVSLLKGMLDIEVTCVASGILNIRIPDAEVIRGRIQYINVRGAWPAAQTVSVTINSVGGGVRVSYSAPLQLTAANARQSILMQVLVTGVGDDLGVGQPLIQATLLSTYDDA